eukprot:CAMPEP_0171082144 /NCGR_PEP_ID=MMETSP0766_2-20121228/16921_1 /TAXON_ID=439317 /ORGANISM="Gambierdiscus australes, Strain CAWD 149" /LENGTH=169 /DNA_ID=CAMNT_0011539485 /DNA_START=127 /DNA_END=633 /DNA_ORIENTATION=-
MFLVVAVTDAHHVQLGSRLDGQGIHCPLHGPLLFDGARVVLQRQLARGQVTGIDDSDLPQPVSNLGQVVTGAVCHPPALRERYDAHLTKRTGTEQHLLHDTGVPRELLARVAAPADDSGTSKAAQCGVSLDPSKGKKCVIPVEDEEPGQAICSRADPSDTGQLRPLAPL